ncbi:MAG TPA: hypothetical protein DCZ94_10720 [Lentisphaeria bacterium]|nr:MAG: hypothetical protein A2X48_06600 [Lentisphaerae bacterium GWF2_49_21]HBC87417.1 hypothetical protein [Lentisphaeria bacterium]
MNLLDEKIDFRKNSRLLFKEFRFYFYAVIFTAFADLVSTIAFMSFIGPDREVNFYVRFFSIHFGIVAGPILGKLLQIFALWAFTAIVPRFSRYLCVLIILLNSMAFFANCYVAWKHW